MWDFKRFAIRHAHFLTHFIRLATESCERVSLIPHRCPIHCSLDYQQHINLNILFSSSFYAFLSNLLFFRSANLTLKNNQIFIYASLCPKKREINIIDGNAKWKISRWIFPPTTWKGKYCWCRHPSHSPFHPLRFSIFQISKMADDVHQIVGGKRELISIPVRGKNL